MMDANDKSRDSELLRQQQAEYAQLLAETERSLQSMVFDVASQIDETFAFLESANAERKCNVIIRDDYVNGLKSTIQNHCFTLLQRTPVEDRAGKARIVAIGVIGNNLERIGDLAVNIVRQFTHCADQDFIKHYPYRALFDPILTSFAILKTSLFDQDLTKVFAICRSEFETDAQYKLAITRITGELRACGPADDLVAILFVFHFLERIGDGLLNIGEAILSTRLGERLKIENYYALKEVLEEAGMEGTLSRLDFESIFGTRSGCQIGIVSNKDGELQPRRVLFKQGNSKKIRQEQEKIVRWEEIMPDLPPKILAYRQEGGSGSIVLEYLEGRNLQDLILGPDPDAAMSALLSFQATCQHLWQRSRTVETVPCTFIRQLLSRVAGVYSLHPEFNFPARQIGALELPSFKELLERAGAIEAELDAQFSVWTHGDCNLDNIIFNIPSQSIHIVDVHRSRRADYLQDVSVFLVSNFRLPTQDKELRLRIDSHTLSFYRFARDFAQQAEDRTFEARLALGLARSFITSTRLTTWSSLSTDLFRRGSYLLQRVVEHQGQPWSSFELPEEVLLF